MKYENFIKTIRSQVDELIGDRCSITVNHIIKNNGKELDGLVIMEEGNNIAPTIYLNDFYKDFKKGYDLSDIVDSIIEIYEKSKDNLKIDPTMFSDFEHLKDRILYKIVNYEKNKKLLKDVPHKKILDLAIVYYCLVDQDDDMHATALIHNDNMKGWNVTVKELHKIAVLNTPKVMKYMIKPLSTLLQEMAEVVDFEESYPPIDMFVLTNTRKLNGAACILYEEILEDFANKLDSDLYILPSSVHEVIILRKNDDFSKEMLQNLVREVNAEGVSEDEVLSDNVYEYNRKDKCLVM